MATVPSGTEKRYKNMKLLAKEVEVDGSLLTGAELAFVDGVTAGTAAASKAVVLGASKEIATITSATITTLTSTTVGATNFDAGASGTAGSVDVFPTTAAKGKIALVAADNTGDTTTTITNAAHAAARTLTIPEAGASSSFVVGGGAANTVTLSANAGTLSRLSGVITTEALTTAAAGTQALTITNTLCAAADVVLISRAGGTSAGGTPIFKAVPGAGSFVITVDNKHASAAFDGTFIIGFLIVKT